MISNFRKILVPLDFTEKNSQALKVARNLARANKAQVTLLHVIETIDYVAESEIERFYEMLKDRARVKLEQLAVPFQDDGIHVGLGVVMGKRGRGIVTYSIQQEVDLIVMSSHRVDLNEAPKGWGSLSHKVSILCPCAVLLVK